MEKSMFTYREMPKVLGKGCRLIVCD